MANGRKYIKSKGNKGNVQARRRKLIKESMAEEDTNASASIFGWNVQIYSTIFLMLKNIRNVSKVRVEGKTEDIEITLNDGKKIYGQAKSRKNLEHALTDSQASSKLSDGLRTLYNASKKRDCQELIYISNFQNPLGGTKTDSLFFTTNGAINRRFSTLPDSAQKLAIQKIKEIETASVKSFPLEDLVIWVLPYDGEDKDVRRREVSQVFRELLNRMKISDSQANNILDVWTGEMFFNASTIGSIQLSKEDLIWALIVYSCDLSGDDDIESKADELGLVQEDIEEITENYQKFIEQKTKKFEFNTKVNTEYDTYNRMNRLKYNKKELLQNFIEEKWDVFKEDVDYPGIEEDIQEALIRIILYKLLNKSKKINKVIQEVGI